MLGYSSYLDKSMNGIKTLTDGISIIQNGNASFNSITTSTININNISNCDFVNCTTSTIPTIPNNIVNKTYCDSNFCDLTTSQIINASKTINNTLYFKDINYPGRCMGAIYLSDTSFRIDAKKIAPGNLVDTGSKLEFYVSPRIGFESDLALMIQGTYGVTDPTGTKIYVSGTLYVAKHSYLEYVNTSSSIYCSGGLTVIGTSLLTGQVTISTNTITNLLSLTTSPTYPNSTSQIATTAFVSSNFCDLTTSQIIAGIKSFSDQFIITQPTITGLISLSTSPIYPDSTNKIASTTFISSNFVDKTTIQSITGSKTFNAVTSFLQNLTAGNIVANNITAAYNFYSNITTGSLTVCSGLISSGFIRIANTASQIYLDGKTQLRSYKNLFESQQVSATVILTWPMSQTINIKGTTSYTLTLPIITSAQEGMQFTFIKTQSITNTIQLNTQGTNVIQYANSLTQYTTENILLSNSLKCTTLLCSQIGSTGIFVWQEMVPISSFNNYVDKSTNQTINGEKKFTNIYVESVINLSYTTVPDYPFHSIGYTTYANGLAHRIVPSGVIYDVLGGGIGIYCGTWLLEYCVTIKPDTSINIDWLMTGISTSPTVFTNYSGFDNTNFKTTISLAQRTILQQQTIHYHQVFVNTTGNMSLFLIGLCNINSGNAYYYNPGVSVLGPYPTPSCYIQATRIA